MNSSKKNFKNCIGGLGLALESLVIVHNSDLYLGALLSSADVFVLISRNKPRMAEPFAGLNYAAIS